MFKVLAITTPGAFALTSIFKAHIYIDIPGLSVGKFLFKVDRLRGNHAYPGR
jgi:hypothetical protein